MEDSLREAARLYNERDWQGCLDALKVVDSTETNHLDLAYLSGLANARLDNIEEALLYLEQVVTSDLDLMRIFQCRLALAYIYVRTGRFRLANYELGLLLDAGYGSVQVLSFMGYLAWAHGKAEESIKWYQKALDLDAENATALNGLGFVLACEGKETARALTYCRKAVDKKPDNAAYLDSLAWAYFRMGFIVEAKTYVGRAISIAPEEPEILEHLRMISGTQ